MRTSCPVRVRTKALGNQGIVANGQRDTSNLFTFNGVNANNLFNGNSTSNISDSRFTLNTGEIFGVGGQVQTNSSVFDAIGQALPTPPVETIQEVHVATSMYDASMGSASGAHVETTTKSGTNNLHGQLYEYYQNNAFDAAPDISCAESVFQRRPAASSQRFRSDARRADQEEQAVLLRLISGSTNQRRAQRRVQWRSDACRASRIATGTPPIWPTW